MARKKASDMSPEERLDALQRQQAKLGEEMKALNAEKACRLICKAYAEGVEKKFSWEDLQEAFETAKLVVDYESIQAEVQAEIQAKHREMNALCAEEKPQEEEPKPVLVSSSSTATASKEVAEVTPVQA